MSSLIKCAADVICSQSNSAIVERDPVLTFFRSLSGKRARRVELKKRTLDHVWLKEMDGKIEILPLDDEFGKIQERIDTLDNAIEAAEQIALALDAIYQERELDWDAFRYLTESKTAELHSQVLELRKEISRGKSGPSRVDEVKERIGQLSDQIKEIEEFRELVSGILAKSPWR